MAYTTQWGFNVKYDPTVAVEKAWLVEVIRAPLTSADGGRVGPVTTGPLGDDGEANATQAHGDGTASGFSDPAVASMKAIGYLMTDWALNGLEDTTPPTVEITEPLDEAVEAPGEIDITAEAEDNVAVASVQFYVNGVAEGEPVEEEPYTVTWDATLLDDDDYVLTAVATDSNGNTTTSAAITVTLET